MHFSLVKMMPQGAWPSNGFDDVILPLRYALARLGFRAETRVNSINPSSVNILFGTCLLPGLADDIFPANSIVFNLEQIATQSVWNNAHYVEHLRRFATWDYSPRNITRLRETFGLTNITLMRLGYVPEMTRLKRDFPQDIDVLFYGAINERRQAVIDGLSRSGVRVGTLSNGYGAVRDHAIARAKMILNVHFYIPAALETVRLGYLWANRKAVVSELRDDTEFYPGLETACLFSPYAHLRSAVQSLLRDDAARKQQEEAAFTAFSQQRQEDFLQTVLGVRQYAASAQTGDFAVKQPSAQPDGLTPKPVTPEPPRGLHAGSGKDFRPDCLNVDIAPSMNPDLVFDLSRPLVPDVPHPTLRFGELFLKPEAFARITAFELLEHVTDLPQLMRNFLDLLCDGGELELSVPYELSPGAWQDPTHVRAFNENSWLYYTDWAWYLGWRDHRFELVFLRYTLSELGRELEAQGRSHAEISRLPRAVDGMHVLLRKRMATDAEKEHCDAMARSYYAGAVGEWTIAQ